MTVEHARRRAVAKPWGARELGPWSELGGGDAAIGEVWFERANPDAPPPSLLLKLLFATEPLSIQVHPDDTFARSIGLPCGKTEAWHVLAAAPGAQVAVGLRREATPDELRASIKDGSINDLVDWRGVVAGETVFVPAGTIHAIGGGLVIAEIQQRGDTTYRLFDYGSDRELHGELAVAASRAGRSKPQPRPSRLSVERTLLIEDPHFVLERTELPPGSCWRLKAERETWMLVIDGCVMVDHVNTFVGEAVYLEKDQATLSVGGQAAVALMAYSGPEWIPSLLVEAKRREGRNAIGAQCPPAPATS